MSPTPLTDAPILRRHAVRELGGDGPPILMVHGYGCNQAMFARLAPLFSETHRVLLMDHVGTSEAGTEDWDPEAYLRLERYAEDVCAVVEALDLRGVTFVGHSVSATICGLATRRLGDRAAGLVMISPSPCYLNDGDYRGGFSAEDIAGLLESIESNYVGWSRSMATSIMGPEHEAEGADLEATFCEQDPEVAYVFARATFESDYRPALPTMKVPTLVLQTRRDIIAPEHVGQYVADHLPDGRFHQLAAAGHCPNYSAPEETAAAIRAFLQESSADRTPTR